MNLWIFFRIRNGYVFLYVLYLTAIINLPLQILLNGIIGGVLYKGFLLVGAALLAGNLWLCRKTVLRKENLFPVLFLLAGAIGVLVHYRYGFTQNVKLLCWMTLQFGIFYVLDDPWTGHNTERLFLRCAKGFMSLWAFAVVLSLLMFLMSMSVTIGEGFGSLAGRRLGFQEERLFGVFADPNIASVGSILSMALSLLFLGRNRGKKGLAVLNIGNMALNWLYVILSGSRTGVLAMLCGSAVFCSFLLYAKFRGRPVWKRAALGLGGAILCAGLLLGLEYGTKAVCVQLPAAYQGVFGRTDTSELERVLGEQGQHMDVDPEISLDREDTDAANISNNRLQIWSDAIAVWKTTPLVGATPRGYLALAEERLGQIFIVTKHYTIHNGYIATLLFSGILGVAAMVAWIVFILRRVFRFLIHKTEESGYWEVLVCTSAIVAVGVAALTLTLIFYSIMVIDAVFWMICGYALWKTDERR